VRASDRCLVAPVPPSFYVEGSPRLSLPLFAPKKPDPDLAAVAAVRLAAIIDSSDDAIVSKTLDGTIMSWNAAAERIFGYSAAEMVGSSVYVLIPPEVHTPGFGFNSTPLEPLLVCC